MVKMSIEIELKVKVKVFINDQKTPGLTNISTTKMYVYFQNYPS